MPPLPRFVMPKQISWIKGLIASLIFSDGTQAFKMAFKLEQQQCTTAFIRNLNENYCGMLFNWAIVAPETLNLSFSIAKGASNPLESVYASGVIV
jgi:hypothetical protein